MENEEWTFNGIEEVSGIADLSDYITIGGLSSGTFTHSSSYFKSNEIADKWSQAYTNIKKQHPKDDPLYIFEQRLNRLVKKKFGVSGDTPKSGLSKKVLKAHKNYDRKYRKSDNPL